MGALVWLFRVTVFGAGGWGGGGEDGARVDGVGSGDGEMCMCYSVSKSSVQKIPEIANHILDSFRVLICGVCIQVEYMSTWFESTMVAGLKTLVGWDCFREGEDYF